MPNDLASAHTMTGPMSTSLELDDIQRGVLHQRPSPYVGTYLLLRIDNPDAGRRLVRRLCPVVEFAQSSPDLAQNASISVGFTYQGLKALGVPRDTLARAGHRAFSVGSDLRQRQDMTKEDWLRQRQDFDRTLYTVRQLRKPIFTAVNGIAYGGGCELAQSTDFIVASDNAVFGQPEAMLGLAAGGGSPALLPRLLPPGKAMQMLMTGDPISAMEAYRLGMVNELYARDELIGAAHRIAEKIASNSPTAVQAVKQAVRMGQGEPIEQAIAIMMEAHWRSAVHPDRAEGIGAFNENREPTFQDSDH
jgi:enoyl-CoA hydratase